MTPRFRRAALALVSASLALVLLELGARLAYRAPWHERLVAEQVSRNLDPFRKNAYRLRGPAYAYPKAKGVRRVLVLGDSFTAGVGVHDDEDVFVNILERRLNEERPVVGVERYELLNGGLGGSHTKEWIELWEKVRQPFDPDLVVIVFFLRDGTRISSMDEFFGPVRDELTARNRASFLYGSSYLYRTIRDRYDKDEILSRYTRRFHDSYFGDEDATNEWQRAQRLLTELCEELDGAGITMGFVIFPVLVYLEEEVYPFADVCELVARFARGAGIAVHDLLPAFRGHESTELWVSALDQHPNPKGHAIAAHSMYPFVVELLVAHEAGRTR